MGTIPFMSGSFTCLLAPSTSLTWDSDKRANWRANGTHSLRSFPFSLFTHSHFPFHYLLVGEMDEWGHLSPSHPSFIPVSSSSMVKRGQREEGDGRVQEGRKDASLTSFAFLISFPLWHPRIFYPSWLSSIADNGRMRG